MRLRVALFPHPHGQERIVNSGVRCQADLVRRPPLFGVCATTEEALAQDCAIVHRWVAPWLQADTIMTWLDAWISWWAGNSIPGDTYIWGITLRWWNRYGQLAQLAGAFMVLFDIVGPERLRRETAKARASSFYRRFQLVIVLAGSFSFILLVPLLLGFFGYAFVYRNSSGPLDDWIAAAMVVSAVAVFAPAGLLVLLDGIAWVLEWPMAGVLFRGSSWLLILCGSTLMLLAS